MDKTKNKHLIICIYLILGLAALGVFWQVRNCDFINYDDPVYVTENRNVQEGLTIDGIRWAFTTGHASNWHPLTWLSHMADCQLFGLDAGRHHLTNLILHIANTLLLFAVFRSMTGCLWQSAFIAAAFALHPLHVESVAWVAERKDVLSTLFWLLAMGVYVRYTRQQKIGWYLLVILFFVLGLMSKPMLVTLPFVLLLLDYWPLERIGKVKIAALVAEKIPLFILSGISSAITFLVQRSSGVVARVDTLSLNMRIANTGISYIKYIGKMFWPSKLAVFYPYIIGKNFVWQAVGAALLLVGISILMIRLARRHKYLLVGWLWYLGTLVPVIGLVQVGSQAVADRYTYVPAVGIFIMVGWAFSELLTKWRYRKIVFGAAGVVVLLALALCSLVQVGYWHNSVTLFEHALDVTSDNSVMHSSLGNTFRLEGKLDKAMDHYREVLRIEPDYVEVYNNVGIVLSEQGKLDEAQGYYLTALQLLPDYAEAHYNLGLVFKSQGRLNEAIDSFENSVRIKPDYVAAHINLGIGLAVQGRLEEATGHFYKALQIVPDDAKAHYNLGNALLMQEEFEDAIEHFYEALKTNSDYLPALLGMSQILATHPNPELRDADQAVEFAQHAAELTGYKSAAIVNTLAEAYAASGQFDKAVETAQRALGLALAGQDERLASYIRKQLERYKQANP